MSQMGDSLLGRILFCATLCLRRRQKPTSSGVSTEGSDSGDTTYMQGLALFFSFLLSENTFERNFLEPILILGEFY